MPTSRVVVAPRPTRGTISPRSSGCSTASADFRSTACARRSGGFVVAEAGTDIVGVAGLEVCCDNALLRSVAVATEWRSHGLGRDLVTRIIADAEARGIHALYLLTTTAERYFPSFGFQPIARDDVPTEIRETVEFRAPVRRPRP